jgi:DNA polymerase III epsilon subunit-like protein
MPGIIVLDCETTGLPPRPSMYKRFPDPLKKWQEYDSARLVELAYKVYDNDQKLVQAVSVLVKPVNFDINNAHIHGITNEMARTFGQRIEIVLTNFICALNKVDLVVCHNVEFDMNIILAEMSRVSDNTKTINYLDIETLLSKPTKCTMKWACEKLQLQKYPKLVDLYNDVCVGGSRTSRWSQAHRALDDVDKCAQCYFSMLAAP